jgi:hypothetical protein
MVGYNPHKPGRPSHRYHTYMMANLRLVLGVDVQPGNEHTPKHGQAGLWLLLDRIGRGRWPALLRGDVAWGVEQMSRAERQRLRYLFRLRMTTNVKRALAKMMAEHDWTNAGHSLPRPSPIGAKNSVAFADIPVFPWAVHAGVV